MTTMKLFIIPWIVLGSMVAAQNQASGPVAGSNPQFVDTTFYQFLQRQNQINNAILLNNAMLANSLGAVTKEHQLRLPNAMPFPSANLHQSGLPTSPTLFQNFPQPIPAVPATGIYDVLSHGLPVNPVLVPTPTSSPAPSTTSSTTTTTADPPRKSEGKSMGKAPDASKEDFTSENDSSENRERSKKMNDGAVVVDEESASTSRTSSLREFVEEIDDETYDTTTKKAHHSTTTTARPRQEVYNLLKTLNLTEEETINLVSHVEKVVREELVKKLAETRLAALNNTLAHKTTKTSAVSANSTTEATTVPTEREANDRAEASRRNAKIEKELLLYLPRKKPETEIKHHPPRVDDKPPESKTDSPESETPTSRIQLPIPERLIDHKSEDDIIGSEENAKIEDIIRTTTAETTITSTTAPLKPPTLPPMRPLPDLRIREGINGTAIMTEEKSFRDGVDADLLNIGLATGAPLDLEAEGAQVVPYRTRNVPATSTSLPPAAVPVFHKAPHVRPKSTTKPKTAFERLAVDYKERLTGAGDMDKFLKSIYSNAYIALIDAKEAPNVRLPLNMRRAAGLYTQ
uniref:Mucin-5AC n=1 Tax=Haemonchus contortus TaxID=6289 RepID=A0A7I4YDE2_HAECO